jgi:hypothetical protein
VHNRGEIEDNDLIHVVWLQLIMTIQSTLIERFTDLMAAFEPAITI